MIRWLGALVVCAGVGAAGAGAEPITLEGLTFSDELGGVRLERGWGKGSLDDPFVLVEEITGDGPAILIVRGMTYRFGNRVRSHHEIGFALTKLVRNGTGEPWSLFNLELREFLDRASPFEDGLSFGQASDTGRPFRSDRFAENIETREPFDGVQFVDGLVEPGETVALSFVITDTTPRWQFYLLQKRDSPLAETPPPEPGWPGRNTRPYKSAHAARLAARGNEAALRLGPLRTSTPMTPAVSAPNRVGIIRLIQTTGPAVLDYRRGRGREADGPHCDGSIGHGVTLGRRAPSRPGAKSGWFTFDSSNLNSYRVMRLAERAVRPDASVAGGDPAV